MLTTKGQRFWMFCIGFLSLLLGAVVLIPFKSIFTHEKIFLYEMIVKLGVIPAIILLLSIYPNKYKYIQVRGARNQSKIVSVVSYMPVVIYLTTIITESIYLLARGYVINGQPPLGPLPWSLWFVALIVFLIAITAFYCVLPSVEMQLDVKEHIIFDIITFVVMVCFGALYYLISKATHGIFLKEAGSGDPYLFVVYLCGLIGLGIHFRSLIGVIRADEVNICLRFNDLDATAYVSKMAEYNRAYNDIMDRFEDHFADEEFMEVEEIEEALEEVEEEAAVEEVQPEEAVEEVQPEEAVEEVQPEETVEEVQPEEAVEESPVQEEIMEQPVESVPVVHVEYVPNEELEAKQDEIEKLETEIEEIRLAKIAEEEARAKEEAEKQAARLEAQRIAEEKALKNKEEMEPSFKKLVQFAKSLEEVSFIENTEKKQIRFLYGKKVFLIMADNPKDYRLQFMADPMKILEWWNLNSEIRPRSNKSDNWFKLINKGSFTEELLFDIIKSSREFVQQEVERIAQEKKEKRALARQQAKEAKENK
ncbi:MAG: hypothetical protein IKC22_04425 [Bacilli bacterium]|nr:hypothetical protein [Bacilli bacterium]